MIAQPGNSPSSFNDLILLHSRYKSSCPVLSHSRSCCGLFPPGLLLLHPWSLYAVCISCSDPFCCPKISNFNGIAPTAPDSRQKNLLWCTCLTYGKSVILGLSDGGRALIDRTLPAVVCGTFTSMNHCVWRCLFPSEFLDST